MYLIVILRDVFISQERIAVPDPDLDIRGGSHPDPEIRGGSVSKKFFWLFGPQFNLKISGGAGGGLGWGGGVQAPQAPLLDSPLNCAPGLYHYQKKN